MKSIREAFERAFKRAPETVTFDDEGVTRTMPSGQTEHVRWDDLEEVRLMTTDAGPYVDDVFWILAGKSSGCVVPSEAQGARELLERLQQLPGFDNGAVIAAMTCCENASFVCWTQRGSVTPA